MSKRCRLLVLAPHQDDEIDLAANTILHLKDYEIYIVYSTNGDNKTSAEVRYKEALNSARELGVPKENVIFLGYGDNQNADTCVFFSDNEPVVSAAGHTETYGAKGIDDYHFKKHGFHSSYTYTNFKNDLLEVILDIKADLIICVDFDSHIDHRMLSLAFDEVMHEILSQADNDYFPEVWKRFGYTMSYFAPEDYTPYNNRENVKPSSESLKLGEFNIVGNSVYQWEDRIRIPANGNYGLFISSHRIVKALKCHVSQYALFRSLRMDNCDEVFWRRRTDNLAIKAFIKGTSGDVSKINDFKLYDTNDIDNISCEFINDVWKPAQNDNKRSITFKWKKEVTIRQIVIYGSILGKGYSGMMMIKSGDWIVEKNIQADRKPVVLDFEFAINTQELSISFMDGFECYKGIAEIEIYENKHFMSHLEAFGRIAVNGTISRKYYIDKATTTLPIELYGFNSDLGYVIETDNMVTTYDDCSVIIPINTKRTELTAREVDGFITDSVVITRKNKSFFFAMKLVTKLDALWLKIMRVRSYMINYSRLLRKGGIEAVFSKIKERLKHS